MERRGIERCPVCQGPMVDGRCRKSICIHNHAQIKCPRCGRADLESVDFKAGTFEYACRECLNKWKVTKNPPSP